MLAATTRSCLRWTTFQILAGAVIAASFLPRATAEDPPFPERLAAAFAALERKQMPVIVGIAHDGDDPIVRSFGALAQKAPATTLIDINSITKTVTAVMVAKLVEQHRLRFDTKLADVFPHVPPDKTSITVHQLLTHTAGLPESVGEDAECLTREVFLERVFRTRLRARPGATYAYANTGYGVLAAIIEVRSGARYEAFLRDDVIGGLGMEHTGYQRVYRDGASLRTARGKTIAEASWGGHPPMWNLIGNGGLVSTVDDMLRFRRAVVDGEIVSRALVARLHTPYVLEDGGESWYGYGVVVQDLPGVGRVYWHDGGNDVFSAAWADYVDRGDVVFTAAADSARGDAMEAMALVAQHLYADALE